MRLSVIIVTKNRAHHIAPCLDSIAAAFARSAPLDAEIVIVNNGSTDNTAAAIFDWSTANTVPIRALWEPRPGKARGLNLALRVARGDLLAFTDDDCRLHPEYVNDLLRHDAADNELVLRGGRVEPIYRLPSISARHRSGGVRPTPSYTRHCTTPYSLESSTAAI